MTRADGGKQGFRSGRGGASVFAAAGLVFGLVLVGCSEKPADDVASVPGETAPITEPAPEPVKTTSDPAVVALAEKAKALISPLPTAVANAANPATPAKVDLGRMLYYDTRLSKSRELSCNSCHALDAYGVDNEPTSPGHKGARGDRNSPTVYNAALHVAQFWDGRAADVEAQAKGPILNPVEMASASEADVVKILESIPGYVEGFAAAFPGEANPISYDNMAKAIGAFERNLLTPSRVDAFMNGDTTALSDQERRGLDAFLSNGCTTCHTGATLGGQLYRKLGFVIAYETKDVGREKVTGDANDRHVFKVPSLRNVVKTGPWFHDGSITSLDEAVRLMGYHQLGLTLEPEKIADIVAFLGALTGQIDTAYIAKPILPEDGPNTPRPDAG